MSDFREQSNKDLDLGAKAYQAGDYETAIRYYEKSADAGNVIALSLSKISLASLRTLSEY